MHLKKTNFLLFFIILTGLTSFTYGEDIEKKIPISIPSQLTGVTINGETDISDIKFRTSLIGNQESIEGNFQGYFDSDSDKLSSGTIQVFKIDPDGKEIQVPTININQVKKYGYQTFDYPPYVITIEYKLHPEETPLNLSINTVVEVKQNEAFLQKNMPIYISSDPKGLTKAAETDTSKFKVKLIDNQNPRQVPAVKNDGHFQGYFNKETDKLTSGTIRFSKIDPNGKEIQVEKPIINKVKKYGTETYNVPPYYKVTLSFETKTESSYFFFTSFEYLFISISGVEIDPVQKQKFDEEKTTIASQVTALKQELQTEVQNLDDIDPANLSIKDKKSELQQALQGLQKNIEGAEQKELTKANEIIAETQRNLNPIKESIKNLRQQNEATKLFNEKVNNLKANILEEEKALNAIQAADNLKQKGELQKNLDKLKEDLEKATPQNIDTLITSLAALQQSIQALSQKDQINLTVNYRIQRNPPFEVNNSIYILESFITPETLQGNLKSNLVNNYYDYSEIDSKNPGSVNALLTLFYETKNSDTKIKIEDYPITINFTKTGNQKFLVQDLTTGTRFDVTLNILEQPGTGNENTIKLAKITNINVLPGQKDQQLFEEVPEPSESFYIENPMFNQNNISLSGLNVMQDFPVLNFLNTNQTIEPIKILNNKANLSLKIEDKNRNFTGNFTVNLLLKEKDQVLEIKIPTSNPKISDTYKITFKIVSGQAFDSNFKNYKKDVNLIKVTDIQYIAPPPKEEIVKYYLLQGDVKSPIEDGFFTEIRFIPIGNATATISDNNYFEISPEKRTAEFNLEFNNITNEGITTKLSDTKASIDLIPGTVKTIQDDLGNKFQIAIKETEKIEEPDEKTIITNHLLEIAKVTMPARSDIITEKLSKEEELVNKLYTERMVVAYKSSKIWAEEMFKDLGYEPKISLLLLGQPTPPSGFPSTITDDGQEFVYNNYMLNENALFGSPNQAITDVILKSPAPFYNNISHEVIFDRGEIKPVELIDPFGNKFIVTLETVIQERPIGNFKRGISTQGNLFLENPEKNTVEVWLLRINSVEFMPSPDARNALQSILDKEKEEEEKRIKRGADVLYLQNHAPVYFDLKPQSLQTVNPQIEAYTGNVQFALRLNGKSDNEIDEDVLTKQNIAKEREGETLVTYANRATNNLNPGSGTIGLVAIVNGQEIPIPNVNIPLMTGGYLTENLSDPITVKIPGQSLEYVVRVAFNHKSEGYFGRGKVLYYTAKISYVAYEPNSENALLEQIQRENQAKKELEQEIEFLKTNDPIYIKPVTLSENNLEFTLNIKDNQLKAQTILDEEVGGAKFAGFANQKGELLSGELVINTNNGQIAVLDKAVAKGEKTYNIEIGGTPYIVTLDFTYQPGQTIRPIGIEQPENIPAKYIIELKKIEIDQSTIDKRIEEERLKQEKLQEEKFLAENIPVYIDTQAIDSSGKNIASFKLGIENPIQRRYPSTLNDQAQADNANLSFITYVNKNDLELLGNSKIIIESNGVKVDTISILQAKGDYELPIARTDSDNKIFVYDTQISFSGDAEKYLIVKLNNAKFNEEKTTFAQTKQATSDILQNNFPIYILKSSKTAEGLDFNLGISGDKIEIAGLPNTLANNSAFSGFVEKLSGIIYDKRKLVLLSKGKSEIGLTNQLPTASEGKLFETNISVDGNIIPMEIRVSFTAPSENSPYYTIELINVDITEEEKTKRQEAIALEKFIQENAAVYIDTTAVAAYPKNDPNTFTLKLDGTVAELKPGIDSQLDGIPFGGYYNKANNEFQNNNQLSVFSNETQVSNSSISKLRQNEDIVIPEIGEVTLAGENYQVILESKFNKAKDKGSPDAYIVKIKEVVNLTKLKQEFPEITKDEETTILANNIPVYMPEKSKFAKDGAAFAINLLDNTVGPIYPPVLIKNENNEIFKGYAKKSTFGLLSGNLGIQMNNQPIKLKEPITTLQGSGTREIRIPETDYTDSPYIVVLEFQKIGNTLSTKIKEIQTVSAAELANEKEKAKSAIESIANNSNSTLEKIQSVSNQVKSTDSSIIQQKNEIDGQLQKLSDELKNAKQANNIAEDNLTLNRINTNLTSLIKKVNDLITQYDNTLIVSIDNDIIGKANLIKAINANLVTDKESIIDNSNSLKAFIQTIDVINDKIEKSTQVDLKDLDNLAQNLQKANSDFEALKNQLITLSASEKDAEENITLNIEKLKTNANALLQKIDTDLIQKKKDSLINIQSGSENANSTLENSITTINEDLNSFITSLGAYITTDSEYQAKETELDNLNKRFEALQIELEALIISNNEIIQTNKDSIIKNAKDLLSDMFVNLEEPLNRASLNIHPSLQQEYKDRRNDIADLKGKISDTLGELNQSDVNLQNSSSKIDAYKSDSENIKTLINEFVEKNNNLNNQELLNKTQAEILTAQTNSLGQSAKELQSKLKVLNDFILQNKSLDLDEKLTNRSNALKADNETLLQDIDTLLRNLEAPQKDLDEISASLKTAQNEYLKETTAFDILRNDADTTKFNFDLSQSELLNLTKTLQQNVSELKTQVTTITTKYAPQTTNQITSLNSGISALETNIDQLLANIPQINGNEDLTNARKGLDQYQANYKDLQTQLKAIQYAEKLASEEFSTTVYNLNKRADTLITSIQNDLINKIPAKIDSSLLKEKDDLERDFQNLITHVRELKTAITDPNVTQVSLTQIDQELKDANVQFDNLIQTLNNLVSNNTTNISSRESIQKRATTFIQNLTTDVEFINLGKTSSANSELDGTKNSLLNQVKDIREELEVILDNVSNPRLDFAKAKTDLDKAENNIDRLRNLIKAFLTKNKETLDDKDRADRDSLNRSADILIKDIETKLIDKLSLITDPALISNKESLQKDSETLLTDIKNIKISINDPSATQTIFDQIKEELPIRNGDILNLIQRLDGLTKENIINTDSRINLAKQANTLIKTIDTDTQLTVPLDLQTANSELNSTKISLRNQTNAIRSKLEQTVQNINNPRLDFAETQIDLNNTQSILGDLRRSISVFLTRNQQEIDTQVNADKNSLNKKANDLIEEIQNKIIDQLSTITDPSLVTGKDTLQKDAEKLSQDIKNIIVSINNPNATQTIFDQIKEELSTRNTNVTNLIQRLDSLTNQNKTNTDSRINFAQQANNLITTIDTDPALTIPSNLQSASSELDGTKNSLRNQVAAVRVQLEKIIEDIKNTSDLPSTQADLYKAQNTIDGLRTSIKAFLTRNQEALDAETTADRNSLNKKADDLIKDIQDKVIDKLAIIIDPALVSAKEDLQKDAEKLSQDIKNIIVSINNPNATQTIFDQIKDELSKSASTITNFIQRLESLTKDNTDNTNSRIKLAQQANDLITTIDTDFQLSIPGDLQSASSELDGIKNSLINQVNAVRADLEKIVEDIKNVSDFTNTQAKLNKAQITIDGLRTSIIAFLTRNQQALDAETTADRNSLDKKADNFIATVQTQIIDKFPLVTDPALIIKKEALQKDAEAFLTDLNNIKISINAPSATQTIFDQIKDELSNRNKIITSLLQRFDSLTKENIANTLSRESLETQANGLINTINTDPQLSIPLDLQSANSELDGTKNALINQLAAVRADLEKIVEDIKNVADFTNAQANLNKAQNTINGLKTSIKAFLARNQQALDAQTTADKNSLNKKADDFIKTVQTQIIDKLSTITDPALIGKKEALQRDSQAFLTDLNNIKISINAPAANQTTFDQIKDELSNRNSVITTLLQRMYSLTNENSANTLSRESLEKDANSLIKTIDTDPQLSIPLDLQSANSELDGTKNSLRNQVAAVRAELEKIVEDIKNVADFTNTQANLKKAQYTIDGLRTSIRAFLTRNQQVLDAQTTADQDSLNKKADDFIKTVQTQIIDKLSTITDPALIGKKEALQRDSESFLTDLNNIKISINAPTATQTIFDQIKDELSKRNSVITTLLQRIYSLTNENSANILSRESLEKEANGLITTLDTDPQLSIPLDLQSANSELDGTKNSLRNQVAAVRADLEKIIEDVKNTSVLPNTQANLNKAQITINGLKTSIKAFLIRNQQALDAQTTADKNSLNKKVNDFIKDVQTKIIDKLSLIIDAALIVKKEALQKDSQAFLTDLNNIKISINDPTATQKTFDQIQEELSNRNSVISDLIQRFDSLIKENSANILSRESLEQETANLIKTIDTDPQLSIPLDLQSANSELDGTKNSLRNQVAAVRADLEEIVKNIKNTSDFANIQTDLNEAQITIDGLRTSIKTFLTNNQQVLDAQTTADRDSLNKKADNFIKDVQTKIIDKLSSITDPALINIKNDLQKDSAEFLVNLKNIKISINAPAATQTIFDQIKQELSTSNINLTNLLQRLDSLAKENTENMDLRSTLTRQANTLINTIDTDHQLSIPLDLQSANSELDGTKNSLRNQVTAVRAQLEKIVEDIKIVSDFTTTQASLNKAQNSIAELKISIKAFLTRNQQALDTQITADKNSLNKKANDFIKDVQTKIIDKLSIITDPALIVKKETIQKDSQAFLTDLNNIKISINAPAATQTTFDQIKDELSNRNTVITTLLQRFDALTKENTANTLSREDFTKQVNNLINTIDTDPQLSIPLDLQSASPDFDNTKNALRNQVTTVRADLEKILEDIKDTSDLVNTQSGLNKAQNTINGLKTSIKTFLTRNQEALDAQIIASRNSLNQKADALIKDVQTKIIDKFSNITDPALVVKKEALQKDSQAFLTDLNNIKISINAPAITQKIFDQIQDELAKRDTIISALIQRLDSLTKENTANTLSRENLENQATDLIKTVDTDPQLSIPIDLQSASPEFDNSKNALRNQITAVRSDLEKILKDIKNTQDFANTQASINKAQNIIGGLRTSIKTFLTRNQQALDAQISANRNSLNKKADDLIKDVQTKILGKLSSITDPSLISSKNTLQEDSTEFLTDLNNIKISINDSGANQAIFDRIKDELSNRNSVFTTLLQRFDSLTKENTANILSRENIKNQATKILNSIDKEIRLPAGFKPAASIQAQLANLQIQLAQVNNELRPEILNIRATIDEVTDLSKPQIFLENAQKDIDVVKESIQLLIKTNQNALLQEKLLQEEELKRAEETKKQTIKDWNNKFNALQTKNKSLTDPQVIEAKNQIELAIAQAKENLQFELNEEKNQQVYQGISNRIDAALLIQEQNRQLKEKQTQAVELELKSLQDNPAVYIDNTPFKFNNKEFTVDLLRQHIDKKTILNRESAALEFSGYVNSDGMILPNGFLAIVIKDFVQGIKERKLPKNGSIIAEVEDDQKNPYIVTLNVTYSKNRSVFVSTINIKDKQLPNIYTIKIANVKNNEAKINERIKAEERAKKEEKKRKETEKPDHTSDKDFVTEHPPVYINQSSQSASGASVRLGLVSGEKMKKILPNQIDGFKFSGYANQNGNLYSGELFVYLNNQVAFQVASEHSSIGKSGTKKVSFTVGDTTYTMKIKSELKPISISATNTKTKSYFLEIVPGSIKVEKIKPKKEKEKEKGKEKGKEKVKEKKEKKTVSPRDELREFFKKHH